MAFNPLVAVVGLAVAGVAAAAAVTWDRWGAVPAPAEVAQTVTQPAPAPAAVPQQDQQTAAVAPKAEEPATAPSSTPQPEAAQPAPAPVAGLQPPAFDIVRVEPDGSALVAGRAEPNATVVIASNGKPLGEAKADSRGEWVWTSPAPLAPGSYAVTLEAAPSGGGASLTSDQAVAVVVPDRPETPLVVLTAPDQPSTVIQKPEAEVAAVAPQPDPAPSPPAASTPAAPGPAPASVSLDAVDYNDQGDIVFTGRGTPGETVRLYVDNGVAGDALVGPDGKWTWSGEGTIAPGRHTLRADQIGAGAKVTSRVELPFMRETPQAVAAAQPQAVPQPTTETAAAQPADPGAPAAQQPGRIVIQPGNNLWNISRVLYGKGTQYTVIYEANRDLIRDPSLIYPGQIFQTPGTTAPSVIDPDWRKPLSEITGQPGQQQN